MSDLQEEVSKLAARVRALEDELAINKVLIRYGFAVDTGDVERTVSLFTEDTKILIDGGRETMNGREEARQIVLGDYHQGILPNCAHTIGPFVIEVEGDKASATGYSRLYLRDDDGFEVRRVSCNRWLLERRDGNWEISERDTVLLGGEASQRVLALGL